MMEGSRGFYGGRRRRYHIYGSLSGDKFTAVGTFVLVGGMCMKMVLIGSARGGRGGKGEMGWHLTIGRRGRGKRPLIGQRERRGGVSPLRGVGGGGGGGCGGGARLIRGRRQI